MKKRSLLKKALAITLSICIGLPGSAAFAAEEIEFSGNGGVEPPLEVNEYSFEEDAVFGNDTLYSSDGSFFVGDEEESDTSVEELSSEQFYEEEFNEGETVSEEESGASLDGSVEVNNSYEEEYSYVQNSSQGEDYLNELSSPDDFINDDLMITGEATDDVAFAVNSVWVGGTLVTADNADDILGGNTASYNFRNHTLTLDGCTNDGNCHEKSAIYATGDLNIVVKGTNSLTSTEGNGFGIYTGGKIVVTGEGIDPTLNVSANGSSGFAIKVVGSSASFQDVNMALSGNRGIVVNENNTAGDTISINNCEIDFASGMDRSLQAWNGAGDASVIIKNNSKISGYGRVLITADGKTGDTKCSIISSDVNLTGAYGIDLDSYNGNSTVSIESSKVVITVGSDSRGAINVGSEKGSNDIASINISNGSDVTLSGGQIGLSVWTWGDEDQPESGKLSKTVIDNSKLDTSGYYYGIQAYALFNGDTTVTIRNNSELVATGGISGVEICSDPKYNGKGSKSYIQKNSVVKVEGGYYGLDVDTSTKDKVNKSGKSNVSVTGGSIESTGGFYVSGDGIGEVKLSDTDASIDMTGKKDYTIATDKLSIDSGLYMFTHYDGYGIYVAEGNENITGGYFNEDVTKLCAKGKYAIANTTGENENYLFMVDVAEAAIVVDDDIAYYGTLKDALDEAVDDTTIKLITNAKLTEDLVFPEYNFNLILDKYSIRKGNYTFTIPLSVTITTGKQLGADFFSAPDDDYTVEETTENDQFIYRCVEAWDVTFDPDNGSEPTVVKVKRGAPVSQPSNPSRNGYGFQGWYEGSSDTPFDFKTPIDQDTTLTGKWSLSTYNITYNLDGGTNAEGNPSTYTYITATFSLADPSKEGYTFVGWTGTDLEEVTKTVTIERNSTGSRTYTANWEADTYKISYDLDGGTVTPENPATYTIESAPITLTNPTKGGYTFAGWTGTDLEEVTEKVVVPTGSMGDRSYQATWDTGEYKIEYDLAGGSLPTGEENPETYTVEDEFTLVNPEKEGYTFAGWTGTDLEEETLEVMIPVGSYGDRSYTATWEAIEYEISYDLAEGELPEGEENPETYTIEDEFTLVNPEREGYTFTGWTGTDLEEEMLDVVIEAGSMGERSYTANWSVNKFKVTFDADGGTPVPENQEVDYDTPATKPADPTKEGLTFTGWFLDGEPTAFDFSRTIKEDTALKAGWAKDTFTVTFDTDGGTPTPEKQTVAENGLAAEPATDPEKEGYRFDGWMLDGEEFNFSSRITADITLKAAWTKLYTVKYIVDGETVSTEEVPENGKAVEPRNPEKEGQSFQGWYNGETEYVFATPVTEDLTLTAKFSKYVAQVGEDFFTSFPEAVQAAQGGVIKLLANTSYVLSMGESITINKNGHTASISAPSGYILKTTANPDGSTTYSCVSENTEVEINDISASEIKLTKVETQDVAGAVEAAFKEEIKESTEKAIEEHPEATSIDTKITVEFDAENPIEDVDEDGNVTLTFSVTPMVKVDLVITEEGKDPETVNVVERQEIPNDELKAYGANFTFRLYLNDTFTVGQKVKVVHQSEDFKDEVRYYAVRKDATDGRLYVEVTVNHFSDFVVYSTTEKTLKVSMGNHVNSVTISIEGTDNTYTLTKEDDEIRLPDDARIKITAEVDKGYVASIRPAGSVLVGDIEKISVTTKKAETPQTRVFYITVKATEGGADPNCSIDTRHAYNTTQNVTVTAADAKEGYKFIGWDVDGVIVEKGKEYTFVFERTITLTATYEKGGVVQIAANDDSVVVGEEYKPDLEKVSVIGIPDGVAVDLSGLKLSSDYTTAAKVGDTFDIVPSGAVLKDKQYTLEYKSGKLNVISGDAVADFVAEVEALPDNPTWEDREKVDKALDDYSKLNDGQKELVKEAKETLDKAAEAVAASEKDKADREAADKVIELINEIPVIISTADRDQIEAARKAYDALTEDQKKLVPADVLEKLEDAEEALAKADEEIAERFTQAVNSVPGNKAGEGKGLVDEATAIYETMTDAQKAIVAPETYDLYDEELAAFAKDRKFRSGDGYYRVLSNGDVTYLYPADKTIEDTMVPNQVKKGKFFFKVIKVSTLAFDGCENLKWVVIHKNIRVLGESIFRDTPSLKKINILGTGFRSGKVENAFVKADEGKLIVKVPASKVADYTSLFVGEGQLKGTVKAA